MNVILGKLPPNPKAEAKYRQITQHLRTLITQGDLKPGTRLPPIKALAKKWDTNYFTVRLALNPLANEGLIERNQGSGTFVRDRKARLTTIAIYYGTDLWTEPEGVFSQRLYHELQTQIEDRGIRCQAFIDTRPLTRQEAALPELIKAIDQRDVQGVIGVMLNAKNISWLQKIGVPLSILSDRGLRFDFEAMNQVALQRLAADGCKTVGMIGRNSSIDNDSFPLFEKWASSHGLKTAPGWFQADFPLDLRGEEIGYQAFKEIWARQVRPDGLLIHHDWVCRGAITAMLELGVRVPQDLRVVLYRNRGIEYLCPWVVPFLELDVTVVAQGLVNALEEQHSTGNFDYYPPPIRLEMKG